MTKDEIIELQSHVYCAKGLYWKLLLGGKFPNDDYAKAIFTCYFTLDKVADLTDKYLLQLPLEEPKEPEPAPANQAALMVLSDTPITDSMWPKEPEPKPRKKVKA